MPLTPRWLIVVALLAAFAARADAQSSPDYHVQLHALVARVDSAALPLLELTEPCRRDVGTITVRGKEDRERLVRTIQTLRDLHHAKLCAEPTLVTASGQEACFRSGSELPVTTTDAAGQEKMAFEPLGLSLNLLPTVIDADRIRLDADLVKSELTEGGTGRTVRQGKTTMELRTGQILIMRTPPLPAGKEQAEAPGQETIVVIGFEVERPARLAERETVMPTPAPHEASGGPAEYRIRAVRQNDQTVLQSQFVKTEAAVANPGMLKAVGPTKLEAADGRVCFRCSLFDATANNLVVKDGAELILEGSVRLTHHAKQGEVPSEVTAEKIEVRFAEGRLHLKATK